LKSLNIGTIVHDLGILHGIGNPSIETSQCDHGLETSIFMIGRLTHSYLNKAQLLIVYMIEDNYFSIFSGEDGISLTHSLTDRLLQSTSSN